MNVKTIFAAVCFLLAVVLRYAPFIIFPLVEIKDNMEKRTLYFYSFVFFDMSCFAIFSPGVVESKDE